MEAATKIIAIGIGGSLGAIARYLVHLTPLSGMAGKFPLPTFVINVVGSFLIGICLILFADRLEISEHLRLAVIVGFIGAFTTFSTFEAEVLELIRIRSFLLAFAYVFSSVAGGFIGIVLGTELGRRF
jgi:fluoride exporter